MSIENNLSITDIYVGALYVIIYCYYFIFLFSIVKVSYYDYL